MKIVGLITEYNPFHNGHKYHIEKAKEITGADTVIVIMSGNYVQRGTPAIMPKHLRAEVALEAGSCVVIELPVCYATASAEYFAKGAISLLSQLNCVDFICFGSECGDIKALTQLATLLADEPADYQCALQNHLKTGMSFPLARQKALKEYMEEDSLCSILDHPNNILGVEYIKALHQLKSTITPFTIHRMVSGYHDTQLHDTYSSASAIRRLLAFSSNALQLSEDPEQCETRLSHIVEQLINQVPASCIQLLEDTYHVRFPVYSNDYSLALKYRLLSETKESLLSYFDMSEDLANRIMNHRNEFISFDQFCDVLKTRELTYSRISRVLFHVLLNIKKEHMDLFMDHCCHYYIHILGFRKDAAPVLSMMNDCSKLPLLTKLTQISSISSDGLTMLSQDIFAADLYESVITEKYKYPCINEYEHAIVRI